MFLRKAQAGFTLVEVIVAVSIIIIMLSILLFSIIEIRKNSRDKQRVGDLAQLEFALTAYREANRDYPSFDEGIAVGKIEAIDADLADFWQIPTIDPVNNATHEYRYDSDVECRTDERYVVIMASSLEREDGGNVNEVCPGLSGYDNAYVVLIDGPITPGFETDIGSIEDEESWWNDPDNRTTINMDAYREALDASRPNLNYCTRIARYSQRCYYDNRTSCVTTYPGPQCNTW